MISSCVECMSSLKPMLDSESRDASFICFALVSVGSDMPDLCERRDRSVEELFFLSRD